MKKNNIELMDTKTYKAVQLFKQGNIKESLRLFSRFRYNITKEENRLLTIAYECLTGKESFYISIGIIPNDTIDEAKKIIRNKFIQN